MLRELLNWVSTCPVDYLVLDMEVAERNGAMTIIFDVKEKEKRHG
jgi:hypothetical protein